MQISNADRVVFPEDGITKGDVADHFDVVASKMLHYIAGRALTVERFPKGIGDKGFMQKNVPRHAPADVIGRIEVPREEGGTTLYPMVDNEEGIRFFTNLGVITFHAPPSRADDMWHPDWVIWDLDPPADGLQAVREAAHSLKSLLDVFDIPSVVMASGSKGYHLRTNIRRDLDAEEVSHLARGVSALAEAAHPDLLTLSFRKADRGRRVFVDWLRNMPLSTSVAPWSLRPRRGAPVACPLSWDEIDAVEPDGVRIGDVAHRLDLGVWNSLPVFDLRPVVSLVDSALRDTGIKLEPFDRFRS